jgi:hypothetical protein
MHFQNYVNMLQQIKKFAKVWSMCILVLGGYYEDLQFLDRFSHGEPTTITKSDTNIITKLTIFTWGKLNTISFFIKNLGWFHEKPKTSFSY